MYSREESTIRGELANFEDEEEMTQPSKAVVTGELISDDEDGLQAMVDDDSSPERRRNSSHRII